MPTAVCAGRSQGSAGGRHSRDHRAGAAEGKGPKELGLITRAGDAPGLSSRRTGAGAASLER